MRCSDCQENISAFLDQELKEGRQREIQTHLDACRECRNEFQRSKQEWIWWKSMRAEMNPTRDLWPQIEREIRTTGKSVPSFSWVEWIYKLFSPDFSFSWGRSFAAIGMFCSLLVGVYLGSVYYYPGTYPDPVVQKMMEDYTQWRKQQSESLRSQSGRMPTLQGLKSSNPFHDPVPAVDKANPFTVG